MYMPHVVIGQGAWSEAVAIRLHPALPGEMFTIKPQLIWI